MYDIITVGSSTIDAFARVESELIKIKTIHHEEDLIAYPCGSKILIKELEFFTGGGGTNTAVAFSRLGLKTGYVGKLGSGTNSDMILQTLRKDKVTFLGLKSKKEHAGYSVILDSLEGDRTILAYKGANNELSFKEIDLKKLKTKWFYFSSMVDKSFSTLESLASFAEDKGIKIAFNPSNYLAEKGQLYLKDLLSKTYLLVLNKEEAMLLAGNLDITELIRRLESFGPKIVIVTDGKDGAYTIKDNKLYHVIPFGTKPVETTGAGDAFASTFLAGLIMKKNIDTCLKMACTNSESVISNTGAKTGLLPYKKLLLKMKERPQKVKSLKLNGDNKR
jgi:ribokinase